jgi:hypothetical protein
MDVMDQLGALASLADLGDLSVGDFMAPISGAADALPGIASDMTSAARNLGSAFGL